MELDDSDRKVRFLIHDRDTKFPHAWGANTQPRIESG
jgi:hypothetical protein